MTGQSWHSWTMDNSFDKILKHFRFVRGKFFAHLNFNIKTHLLKIRYFEHRCFLAGFFWVCEKFKQFSKSAFFDTARPHIKQCQSLGYLFEKNLRLSASAERPRVSKLNSTKSCSVSGRQLPKLFLLWQFFFLVRNHQQRTFCNDNFLSECLEKKRKIPYRPAAIFIFKRFFLMVLTRYFTQ